MAYGTINADVVQSSVTGVSLGAGNATRFKNRIINGDMRIDQRFAGASTTPSSGGYLLDRFFYTGTQASKMGFQQNYGAVTLPIGFSNYLGMFTITPVSVGVGDTFLVTQNIEGFNTADLGFGTANAKTVTLSFQVYSSLTGTFGGALSNSGASRSYPFSYSIPTANTWTTISVTIAGDTSGTWIGSTNGIGLVVRFGLGSGSTFSGTAGTWAAGNYVQPTSTVSVVGTSGATFFITGVQLEVGSSATGFEYVDYTTQLVMCQRYYFRRNIVSTSADVIAVIQAYGTGDAYGKLLDLPVTMRTTPTGTLSAIGNFRATNALASSATAFTSGSIDSVSPSAIGTSGMSGSSGLVAGSATVITANTTAAWIAASAEL